MNTPTKGSTSNAVRNLAALSMLAMLASCVCEKPADGPRLLGPRTGNVDTVTVVPNSPGPHPTLIRVASNHTKIDASKVHVYQGTNPNGTTNPYWVTIKIDTQEALQPTATVSPQQR